MSTPTPSEKLDAILAAGGTPHICEIVDCRRYPYVWGGPPAIRCGKYLIHIALGLLSDGASCVPDRNNEAWFAHDRLYLSPWAEVDGKRVRLPKWKCDMVYARLGARAWQPVVALEGLFLATGINRRVWNRYREQDEATLLAEHTVPHPHAWVFETQYTRDAVWVGEGDTP
jgi:hypothetical protein